ncbi:hypothetical protein WDV94_07590 [Clavibacter tessellarius]
MVLIAALWFVVTFLVFPNANLLVTTFFPDGAFSGRALEKLVSAPTGRCAAWATASCSRSPSRSRSTWSASSSCW